LAAFFALCLIFGDLCAEGISTSINTVIAVGSATLVAAGVMLTAAVKLHSEERDRAYRFLTENQKSQEFLGAMFFIARFRALNGGITVEQAGELYTSGREDHGQALIKIAVACNFFEEMGIGVRSQQINEYIVREFYAGMLYRVGNFMAPVLPIIRNDPIIPEHPFGDVKKPEVCENMFWLYERWAPAYGAKYLQQEEQRHSSPVNANAVLIVLVIAIAIVALHSFGCPAGSVCAYLLSE
jgi:hypothetical protein